MRRFEVTILLLLLLLLASPAAAIAAPARKGEARDAPAAAPAPQPPAAKGGRGGPAGDADDARPTQEEVRRAFDGGDYKGALQMLARVVNLRGAAGAAYDKYELWMLKGESHLRLRQLKPAGEAFAAAARETDDEVQAATARATQRLLAEAKAYRITRRLVPKGEKARTADLLDPEQRADALRILYEDERAATRPKVEAALRARKLAEIAAALELAEGLHDFELAATGGDADLSQLRGDLADRAETLMSKELDRLDKDVTKIRDSAEQLVERRRRRTTTTAGGAFGGTTDSNEIVRTHRRGLRSDDIVDLRAAIETCRQVILAAKSLAKAGGGDPEDAADLVDRARDVGEAANRVLNKSYGAGRYGEER